MNNQFKKSILISLIISSIWFLIVFFVTKSSMFWGGDSIEFMSMMHQFQVGKFPKSDIWLPLYPIVVGFLSELLSCDLFEASRIYALMFSTLFVFIYNYLFVNKFSKKGIDIFLLNIPIFSFIYVLKYFVTIMAELQFFILSMGTIYFILNYVKTKKIFYLVGAILLALLSLMTKYNGIANLTFLTIIIFYTDRIKATRPIFLMWCVAFVFYFAWLSYKPGEDFLTGSITLKEFNLFQKFQIQSYDLTISILEYSLPYRGSHYLKSILPLEFGILFLIFYIIFSFYFGFNILMKFLNKDINGTEILKIYVFLFVCLTAVRQIFSGVYELNTRTLLYPYFVLSVLFVLQYRKKFSQRLILVSFGIIGLISTINNSYSMFKNGDPYLNSQSVYSRNDYLIKKFLKVKNELKIPDNLTFSNQDKILSIHNNFCKIERLPISRHFKGNNNESDNSIFQIEKSRFLESIKNRNFLILHYNFPATHPRYDYFQNNFIEDEFINNDLYNLLKTENGYCIWPKKQNLRNKN